MSVVKELVFSHVVLSPAFEGCRAPLSVFIPSTAVATTTAAAVAAATAVRAADEIVVDGSQRYAAKALAVIKNQPTAASQRVAKYLAARRLRQMLPP